MNANSLAVAPNVWEGQPVPAVFPLGITVGKQGASSSTETIFLDAKGVTTQNPTGQAIARVDLREIIGRNVVVRVFGRLNTAATLNTTIKLYAGASLFTSGFTAGTAAQTLATTGAVATNTILANFDLEAELTFDNDSGSLNGVLYGQVGNSQVARAPVTAITGLSTILGLPGSVTFPSAETELDFGASFTFSVANAANYVIIDGLEVETY